jgi:hypothetical protein
MSMINGGSQSNPSQRKLERYEQFVADYKTKVGQYPATPIELAPKNGVPKGGQLDTFHRMAKDLGVPVISELEDEALPVGERGYKQLLNTVASIVSDRLGFLGSIKNIHLKKSDEINASMSLGGQLSFNLIDQSGKIASILDFREPFRDQWLGSLRNTQLITEHEGVHNFLMGSCRDFLSSIKDNYNIPVTDCPLTLTDQIMSSYIKQLTSKSPNIMANASSHKLLTDYFLKEPQELFTTLFEAIASEILYRTAITDEMAMAVGSTKSYLENQKKSYAPPVSTTQKANLNALTTLIQNTPLNLMPVWINQTSLRNRLFPNNEGFYTLPYGDEAVNEASWGLQNVIGHLDKTHPELYNFVLNSDKIYPELYQHPEYDPWDPFFCPENILKKVYTSEESKEAKPLTSLVELITSKISEGFPAHGSALSAHQEFMKEQLVDNSSDFISQLKALQLAFKFAERMGRSNPLDDLFYSDTRAKGLPLPLLPEEAKFLAEYAHLLDLPKRFMTMLENLDEKELMITMLHRLV